MVDALFLADVMDHQQATFNDTNLPDANDPQDSEEVQARKRKERLEQNRISARESRKRKKSMIEELQRTVITLSRENKDLNERNESLRRQLMELASKYPNVVPLQAIMGQNPPPATTTQANSNNAAVAVPKIDDPLSGTDPMSPTLADWMNLPTDAMTTDDTAKEGDEDVATM